MSEIVKVNRGNLKPTMDYAAQLILSGKVISFPTDTSYSLGADPYNLAAVNTVLRIKRRPHDRNLRMLVASLDQALELVADPPRVFFRLAERFWPGPLTIIVPASKQVPFKITGETGRVAIRWPRAPIVLALVEATSQPLAGVSANSAGFPPPSNAHEADQQVGGEVSLIIDGGSLLSELPSTVVELDRGTCQIRREGRVTSGRLAEFLP